MRLQPDLELRIQRLRRLPKGRKILSVYLETEPGMALHHGHTAKLLDILRDLRENVAPEDQALFSAEAERVLEFVRQEYVPHGQSLVIFSSRPRRLWETLALQLPIPSIGRFAETPYLTPLDMALEDYPRVAVVLVNAERARLMTTVLSEVEAEYEVRDDIPGRQRQGGWAAFKYQRAREYHIHEHFGHVVGSLLALQKSLPFKWLAIGGADDATDAVMSLLPKSLKAKFAGTFRDEQFRSDTEIAAQGARLADQAERLEELRLTTQICNLSLAGGAAALGWGETVATLREGRVHHLAIGGAQLGSTEADSAIGLASDTRAKIEVVHGDAEAMLSTNGGIGAILRY